MSVAFAPSASGLRSGTLNIVNNGGSSPEVVPLSGTGADFTLAVESKSKAAATVTARNSETYQVVVSSASYSKRVDLACIGAPPAGTCSVQPAAVQLTGNIAVPVTVTVTTTANPEAAGAPGFAQPIGRGLLWLAALGLLALARLRNVSSRGFAAVGALLVLGMPLCAFVGCSHYPFPPPPSTPAGKYTIVLVATGRDGLQQSLELSLTVH